ncbi:hypothetical protein TNCV_2345061 [Trichonephila clavipes]|nr:hypothetical protein TNCV_2345061 [Trichonephila clavipes]
MLMLVWPESLERGMTAQDRVPVLEPLKTHRVEGTDARYICRCSESSRRYSGKLWGVGYHLSSLIRWAAVVKWSRYRIVTGLVTSSSPVPLKTRRVGERCTLNLSRAQTTSRWCGS